MSKLHHLKPSIATLGIVLSLGLAAPQAGLAQATVLTGNVSALGTTQAFSTNQVNLNGLMSEPAARAFQNPPPLRSAIQQQQRLPQQQLPQQQFPQQQIGRQPRPLVRTVYVRDNRTFFERHPKVKAASIGAGVGAGAGALTGLVTGRGMVRGALIGGGTGAGVGLVRSSTTMKRHPIMRDVATGGLVGLGLGASGSRYHRTTLEATGLGAAVGLGVGMWKHMH